MSSPTVSVRKENAKKLAEGYSTTKRIFEICCLTSFSTLFFYGLVRTLRYYLHTPEVTSDTKYYIIPSVLAAVLLADFLSGVAHWGFDTWGTPETPVFGAFIRSFREHHVDQTAITKHDFIETNGDNTMPCIPALLLLAFLPITPSGVPTGVTFHAFVVTLTLLIAITNQCHKWAHEAKPHPLPKFLMSNRILLTPQVHRNHHKGEYDCCYCITTGWLNGPLDAWGFWRWAERQITALTGAVPRANDAVLLGKQQAAAAAADETAKTQ